MFLTYETDTMNYEALGRYVEAKEKAEKLARNLHNLMGSLSRLTSPSGAAFAQAKEYDFASIKKNVSEAEEVYSNMLAAVDAANREASLCGREAIKVAKW
jgi:hypothetical protein